MRITRILECSWRQLGSADRGSARSCRRRARNSHSLEALYSLCTEAYGTRHDRSVTLRVTPQPVIEAINRETNAALKAPDVQQSLIDTGATALGGSPEDFGAFIKDQSEKWGAIIRESGAQLD